jgi:SAM-dependent methyltransferase
MIQKDWFASWFNTSYYHDLYAKRNDEEAQAFMDILSYHFKWSEEISIVDACCGAGRHALYLESKGFNVQGVDLSENNVLQAQSLSKFKDRWMIADVRSFQLPAPVDFALNLFTSFGYFETDEEHLNLLRNIHRNLVDEGMLVLDFFNVDLTLKSLKEKEWFSGQLATYQLTRSLVDGKIIKDISFVGEGQEHRYQERVMAYSKSDLESLLVSAGFRVMEIWGDYQGLPFQPTSTRCIFIAQKTTGA